MLVANTIELSLEDLELRKSHEYPGRYRLLEAAKILKTTEFERGVNEVGATYNKRSIVGMIMSGLGWSGGSDCTAKSGEDAVTLRKNQFHINQFEYDYYYQEAVFMLSSYVIKRLDDLDRQKKTNDEIVDWLIRMAE